jgi:hypothetical protein
LRSNFGLELWTAYNDSGATTALTPGAFDNHPSVNARESQSVAQMGEAAYNAQKSAEARQWIRAHPRRAMLLFWQHVYYFWFPPQRIPVVAYGMAMLTLASAAGLIVLWKQNSLAAVVLATIWVTFPIMYYFVIWSSRYRYPMEWTLILTSAVLLDYLWSRGRRVNFRIP